MRRDHFLAQLYLAPYGVLGWDDEKPVASEPGSDLAIVDPAGIHHIQEHGPRDAGAAAGSIYQWLGLRDAASFPEAVRQAITR
eukprot:2348496-Alexandrium_andersonii.AAC.1